MESGPERERYFPIHARSSHAIIPSTTPGFRRWRTKYGGMDPQMARQLQELQKENARLKRLVADQALDNQILREAARPNW